MDSRIEKLNVENGDVLVLYYTLILPHLHDEEDNQSSVIKKLIDDITNHYKKHGKDVLVIALPMSENLNSNN